MQSKTSVLCSPLLQGKEISIGCDPEVFVEHNNQTISAHGLIPGDKRDPFIVKKGAIQVDGMALEFNIEPATTLKQFLTNIETVMNELKTELWRSHPQFKLKITPTVHFTEQYMKEQPDEARRLGCEPDFNAYTGKQNPSPCSNTTLRTAAGHIHVGWGQGESTDIHGEHVSTCQSVIKQLDAVLFSLSPLWDTDTLRRRLYGSKGSFRPKHYGVEYRVLSNQWLLSKPLQAWVFQATMKAVKLLQEGVYLFNNPVFATHSHTYLHPLLVKEYGFPTIPVGKP